MKCVDCGEDLTKIERTYYEFRCEICEDQLHHRIQGWRKGGHDEHLSLMFKRGDRVVH